MTLSVGVIGAGYWGPKLVRNFDASPHWDLAAVCDLDESRARALVGRRTDVEVHTSVVDLLASGVDAVAIATPAGTHAAVALQALEAGKHVVVEKPIADDVGKATAMVAAARERGLVLMLDHTYCYTPAVQRIGDLIAEGTLGDILFVDSVRINLGLVQPDVDVLWDLAPHDLSILDYVLPGGLDPVAVSAHGADPLGAGRACIGYLTMPLPGGAIAHVHVNWLSPTKIRQMVIAGTRRTLVWDDLNPQQRISVYDRGVDLRSQSAAGVDRTSATVSYRLGDMHAPALPEREALAAMVEEFASAITEKRQSRTPGDSGLRVLSVLDAAKRSLAAYGATIPMPRADRAVTAAGAR